VASKRLVLDANILIRAVLGVRVRSLVEAHCERVAFFVASESLVEAENYLGEIAPARLDHGDRRALPSRALIAAIHFNTRTLYVRAVLTHAEYDDRRP
jgi:hypothetical protein